MLSLIKRKYVEFPPEVKATWPIPNYIDPITRGPELYIINGTWLFIATICVAARLYTRLAIRNYFGWDDVCIIIAIVAAYGVGVIVFIGYSSHGWDRHIYDIPLSNVTPSGKLLYAARIVWAVASASVRFSVVFLYYRLLDHAGLRRYRWVLHANSVFMVGVFLTQELTGILACLPPKAMWAWPQIENARCLNNGISMFAGAVLNTISEFIVACLPIPLVFTLGMSQGQRYSVISLLSLGLLVVVCGVLRTHYIWLTYENHDPAWWAGPHWICSEVEIDTAIICACAPVLKPMLSRLIRRGPSAAHKPNLKECGYQPDAEGNKRARSLFSKKMSHRSENLNSFGTESSTLHYNDVDIEGIANDGFGYTVKITGGVRVERMTKLQRLRRMLSSSEESLGQQKSAIHGHPESLGGQTARNATNRVSTRNPASILPVAKRKKQNEILDIDDKHDSDITTERTFDVRESYHEQHERGWDPRNPYRKQTTEKDLQIDQSRPSWRTAEWSYVGGEISHVKSSLPDLGKKDRKASFEELRFQTETAAGLEPLTGKEVIFDQRESKESPHTMFPEQTYPRSIQAQRLNTTSPPPNQFGGRTSPAVQPINSSQWWASRPPQLTLGRADSPPVLSITENLSEPHIAPSKPLEVVLASAWDKGRTNSLRGSVGAMDSNRMLSLKDQNAQSYDDAEHETMTMDEELFNLPVEKPPSWPGGSFWGRDRAGSAGRPRSSRASNSWEGAEVRPGTSFEPPARPGTAL